MTLRLQIQSAMTAAMKDRNAPRLSTLRLILAAIKDREIANRTNADREADSDQEIIELLGKLVRQRRETAQIYEEAGRLELAERELAEIDVIQEFLPRQLTEEEADAAISNIITALNASSIRDIGRVMAALKKEYAGRMDFAAAGALLKSRLG